MMVAINLGIILISSFALIKSIKAFINSTSSFAKILGISGFTITYLIIALSTSIPETLVGLSSVLKNQPLLAFGNVLGSNVALLTLVPALSILLVKNISTRSIIESRDIYYTALFSLLPIILSLDGLLSRTDGAFLFVAYFAFGTIVVKKSQGLERFAQNSKHTNLLKEGMVLLISLGIVFIASESIVRSAISLSANMGLTIGFIGLIITAIGTSLPEIGFALESFRKGQQGEIMGDIVESIVANSTFVLGLTALISPIKTGESIIGQSTLIFMVITLVYFLRASRSGKNLNKLEALTLIGLYILFISAEYYFQGI